MDTLIFETRVGNLKVSSNENLIIDISLTQDSVNTSHNTVLLEAKRQLIDYFMGRLKVFELPLDFNQGTPFQIAVWKAVYAISYGKTSSYKEIGHSLGYTRGFQAIAQAVGRNPFMIVVPCHRVIGSNGKLVGYYYGLEIKKQLLELEGNL